ncbi:hypothetical protein I6E29_08485 [Arcanobacterium haemolyticum]|nr:hypothetical protein [Arcanobacterium haemolyticum]
MSTTPAPPLTWEDSLAAIVEACRSVDRSDSHARLTIELSSGADHPVMVWHGESAASGREVIHVAAPVRRTGASVAELAAQIDEFPSGALRLLGDLPHVHEALPLGALATSTVVGVIKLIATEAASLESAGSDGEAA